LPTTLSIYSILTFNEIYFAGILFNLTDILAYENSSHQVKTKLIRQRSDTLLLFYKNLFSLALKKEQKKTNLL